jgi:hypothetical protein
MNKTKIILSATGGVALLGVLVMSYLLWTAFQQKSELQEELSSALNAVESLSRAKVYPGNGSILAIGSNVTKIVEWKEDVFRFVSAGDRVYQKTSASAFKNYIVDEAKRLQNLPGSAEGKIMKKDFAFGPFKEYVFSGSMPLESSLLNLQRQWDDIVFVVETLASAQVSEILDIQYKVSEAPKENEDAGNKKRNKRRAKAKKQDVDEKKLPKVNEWLVTFEAKPSAFVKILNTFAVSERFSVVGDISLNRKKDSIVEALGAEEDKEATSRRTSRRRRSSSQQQSVQPDESKNVKNGIVTDPQADEPLVVSMAVKIYDFRTLESTEEKSEGGVQEKGDVK